MSLEFTRDTTQPRDDLAFAAMSVDPVADICEHSRFGTRSSQTEHFASRKYAAPKAASMPYKG